MMNLRRTGFFASVTALAGATLLTGSAWASAAVAQPVFNVSTHRLMTSTSFTAGATNVADQCLIRYQVRDINGDVLFVAKRHANSGQTSLKLTSPSATGQFFVGINVYGKDCAPDAKASTLISMRAV